METLLPVAERMNERKLAPVMAEMNPAKAKEITHELSKRRQVTSGSRSGGAG
jgi:flagellar motility protein MotE (MotC chaperone)